MLPISLFLGFAQDLLPSMMCANLLSKCELFVGPWIKALDAAMLELALFVIKKKAYSSNLKYAPPVLSSCL